MVISGWVEITRFKNVDLQLAYTHSIHYRLDFATVVVTFDATLPLRQLTGTAKQ